ncbi:MAG: DUF3788 family protein [Draconibacterium sp.]|nr:DUF3788 family protein [Draconibacterium sp.]
MDLSKTPKTSDLEVPLGSTFAVWNEIRDFVFEKYPAVVEEWHVSVKKYGWGFRIKDKKTGDNLFVTKRRVFLGYNGFWSKSNRQDFKF